MHPCSKLCTNIGVLLVGLLFVPMASAVPISGALNGLQSSQLADRLAASDENRLKDLVKEAGVRLRIGYGRYGGHRYGRYYPRYGGYGNYGYYPSYSRGYRSRRHYYRPYKYRKHRYSRRSYKKRRALRRLRRLLRHRLYY